MIDIRAFFEYTTDVSPGKMVTIYRKKLLPSCLFLLGYTSFFLLAVSGSYDYTASAALVRELEPSEPEKYHSEWLSNHEWDYPSLKGNYHARRKSRSTLEKETSRAEGAWTEEASRGARGKWVPRRERKFERSVGPESIGNASGFVQEEKEEEDSDAIETTTLIVEPFKEDNNLENTTMKEVSNDTKGEEKDHLKDEVSVEEGTEENATDILDFRSLAPRFPTELGQEGLDVKPKDQEYPTQRWGTTVKIYPKEFRQEQLRSKPHRHRNGGKNLKEEEEEGMNGEKEQTDVEESNENGQKARNPVFSYGTEFPKLLSDAFLPMQRHDTGSGYYPWKALTSSQYTKEIMKQEGPHLKTTTKETKSKVSVFFANDRGQTTERMNDPTNPSKIDNPLVVRMIGGNESTEAVTKKPIKATTKESIEATTKESIEATTAKSMIPTKKEDYESEKENFEKSSIFNEKYEIYDTIYHIFDTTVFYVTNILYLPDQPILLQLVSI